MKVELKQRLDSGNIVDAGESDISLLKTKANIASIAQRLSNCSTRDEKLEIALKLKSLANDMFNEASYSDALETYVECLAASSFEDDAFNNVDSLVVPVLSNMGACCLKLKQYGKCYQFCENALKLRPNCEKVLLRCCVALLELNEYCQAQKLLNKLEKILALRCDRAPNEFLLELGDADCQRIPILTSRILQGIAKDEKDRARQKRIFEKEFRTRSTSRKVNSKNTGNDRCDQNRESTSPLSDNSVKKVSFTEYLKQWIVWLIAILNEVLSYFKLKNY